MRFCSCSCTWVCTRHLHVLPSWIVTVVHTNTLSWLCLLSSALCCQRDLRLTYSIPLTCRPCACQHEACLTSSRKQLWSHLSSIYVSCFTMFHPHSEGPRSVHRIFQNSPGWKQDLCWTDLRKSKFWRSKDGKACYVFTWNAVWTTVDAWNPL